MAKHPAVERTSAGKWFNPSAGGWRRASAAVALAVLCAMAVLQIESSDSSPQPLGAPADDASGTRASNTAYGSGRDDEVVVGASRGVRRLADSQVNLYRSINCSYVEGLRSEDMERALAGVKEVEVDVPDHAGQTCVGALRKVLASRHLEILQSPVQFDGLKGTLREVKETDKISHGVFFQVWVIGCPLAGVLGNAEVFMNPRTTSILSSDAWPGLNVCYDGFVLLFLGAFEIQCVSQSVALYQCCTACGGLCIPSDQVPPIDGAELIEDHAPSPEWIRRNLLSPEGVAESERFAERIAFQVHQRIAHEVEQGPPVPQDLPSDEVVFPRFTRVDALREVAPVLADVLFGLLNVFSMLASQNYFSALSLLTVWFKTTFEEVTNGPLLRVVEEFRVSLETGVLTDGLTRMLLKETGLECVVSLCVTVYAIPFVRTSDISMYLGLVSIFLSLKGLAKHLYHRIELGLDETQYGLLRATESS